MKFWGKINGTARDYFIVESDIELDNQEEITEPHEARREEGVNKKTYFVTNDRSSILTQLSILTDGLTFQSSFLDT